MREQARLDVGKVHLKTWGGGGTGGILDNATYLTVEQGLREVGILLIRCDHALPNTR